MSRVGVAVPDGEVDLPPGGQGTPSRLDITRLQDDTGYEPAYGTERAAADYLAWLRSGNQL